MIETIGYIATILVGIAYMPQLLTIIVNKRVENISVITYVCLLLGLLLWCGYAIGRKDWPLLTTNLLSIIQILTIIVLYIRYNEKDKKIHIQINSKSTTKE